MVRRLILLAAFFVIFLPCLSIANTDGPYTASISSALTDWTGTLSFQQFNPALGTLNSVEIELFGSMDTVLTVTNNSDEVSSGHANTHLKITVQDLGHNLIDAPQIDMWSPDFDYVLAAYQSLTSGLLTKNDTYSHLYTNSVILNEFTGIGNIVLDAGTFTETALFNTGGNTDTGQVTHALLNGTVTYNYTVPEPATITLLCAGAFALLKRKSGK
ncbi:MAG: choice-of-anchor E domain-containing protein [Sedimentisphaerales bacterium]